MSSTPVPPSQTWGREVLFFSIVGLIIAGLILGGLFLGVWLWQ